MGRPKDTLMSIDSLQEEESIMIAYSKPGYMDKLSPQTKERIDRFNLMHELMIEHRGDRLKVEEIMTSKGYPKTTVLADFPIMERVFGRVKGYDRAYENLMAVHRLRKAINVSLEKNDLKNYVMLEKEYREATKHDVDNQIAIDFEEMKKLFQPTITFHPEMFKVKNDRKKVGEFLSAIDKKYGLELDNIENADWEDAK